MDEQSQAQKFNDTLKSFLKMFTEYSDEIFGDHRPERLDALRSQLQQLEPQITNIIVTVLSDGVITLGSFGRSARISHRDLIPTALLGGNNELTHNFHDYKSPVTNMLNRALGTIKAGLWPSSKPQPILVINDAELRTRCSDLLGAPGSFDRVLREATTILEDRLRNKCPHLIMAQLIPNSADQIGEKLVNVLLKPESPVLSISNDKTIRVAFHRIMLV